MGWFSLKIQKTGVVVVVWVSVIVTVGWLDRFSWLVSYVNLFILFCCALFCCVLFVRKYVIYLVT